MDDSGSNAVLGMVVGAILVAVVVFFVFIVPGGGGGGGDGDIDVRIETPATPAQPAG